MHSITISLFVSLIAATLRLSTPIIFAALGGVISERSGVVNIGLEGIMIAGAFFAVLGSYLTQNAWVGILFAILAGMGIALIHAVLSINLRADQTISGVSINIFSAALMSFLLFKIFAREGQTDGVTQLSYPKEFFKSIPLIGNLLAELNWFVFIAFILAILLHLMLYYTPLGLRIRSVGEHPKAADTLGINVYKIRYLCVLLSGAFAGLGGASLSLGATNLFREGMVSGKGFIALAAMIFGNWKPFGALAASLLFGFAEAFRIVAQGFGWKVPDEVYYSFPYVLTMLMLAGFVGKTTPPAADGIPYTKGER